MRGWSGETSEALSLAETRPPSTGGPRLAEATGGTGKHLDPRVAKQGDAVTQDPWLPGMDSNHD